MIDTAQNLMVIIGGCVLIVILLWILVIVRRQTRRLKDLEAQMKVTEKMEEAEYGKESIL